jgi:4,5:9,10-diseco-3-hydroxy-5,9,17-trioxoandrosta-1(10),2-diene-4-oate hydrolase
MTLDAAKKIIPEGKYADVGDGLQIHYHDEGRGEPVLFLHGSGPGASGWSNFRRNYPYLAERGFRTLVPDTLGFGYSSKPENTDYTLDFVAGAMIRFLDKLGVDKVTAIGNSHGGALAIKLALDHPHSI